ncbi:MAG: hypothetical protein FWE63_06115 [Bacteroidales bacterium]|nr:hypothetical protein [Bacteroidales bacterium]
MGSTIPNSNSFDASWLIITDFVEFPEVMFTVAFRVMGSGFLETFMVSMSPFVPVALFKVHQAWLAAFSTMANHSPLLCTATEYVPDSAVVTTKVSLRVKLFGLSLQEVNPPIEIIKTAMILNVAFFMVFGF